MKGKKEVKKAKQGRALKEVIPAGFNKPVRQILQPPLHDSPDTQIPQDFQLPSQCPLWPGDDAALVHDFGMNASSPFLDDFEYTFPPSIYQYAGDEIIWSPPQDLMQMNQVISRFSKRYKKAISLSHINTITVTRIEGPIQVSIEQAEKMMSIVTSHQRDQTNEQFEQRKQKQIDKQAQVKGKKAKIEEIVPGKIREVKLGNIEMGKPLPLFSKWLSSQLQILKDLRWKDSHTGDSLWSRIYPQRDGVPVFNPSGKYWVKLFMFGVPYLVEIDSMIPATPTGEILLPRSSTIRDIWPIILSKAYLKLHSFRWKNINKFISSGDDQIDGSFIHAITGLLPQKINIDMIGQSEWEMLERYLQNQAWENKNFITSVHCKLDTTPTIPSMTYSSPQQKTIPEEPLQRLNSYTENKEEYKIETYHARPGSGGSPIKIKTPAEKLRDFAQQALQVQTGRRYSFKKQSRPCYVIQGFGYMLFELFSNPEYFDMRKVKKKEKLKQADQARTALLRAKAVSPARKLRRHQSPARLREYQKRKQRREKEKEERRQKLLQKKQYPIYRLLKVKTSVTNVAVLNIECPFQLSELQDAKLRIVNHDYFLQQELDALEKLMDKQDIELFNPGDSNVQDFKIDLEQAHQSQLTQPESREKGGVWISSEDFPYAFQQIVVYHDIQIYPYNLVLDDLWKDVTFPYTHNDNYDIWIIQVPAQQSAQLVVGFAPQICDNLKFNPNSIVFTLQAFNFESEEIIQWEQSMKISTTSVQANHLILKTGEYILKPTVSCAPCGSVVWISSTHQVVTMSRPQFLTQRMNWVNTSMNFSYNICNKKQQIIPLKAELTVQNQNDVVLKLSGSDPNIFECAELILVNRSAQEYQREYRMLDIKTLHQNKISLESSQKGYLLLLYVFPIANLSEGSLNLEMVCRSQDVKITSNDLLDPVQITDKYTPNKYGIIFKQHVFLGEDTHFSLHVRLRKGPLPKIKQLEQTVINSQIITLELFQQNQLIASASGYNQAYIRHININHSTSNLLLVCKYDSRQWTGFMGEQVEGIHWVLRIISNQTVALIKDTRKEDNQESIRKSWQTSQPGRAQQAKISRARYLAQIKKQTGQKLTDQQTELLKETWEERRKARREGEMAKKTKGKQEGKKKEQEKQEEEEVVEDEKHVIKEIQAFYQHVDTERVLYCQGEPKIYLYEDAEQSARIVGELITEASERFSQKKQDRNSSLTEIQETKQAIKNIAVNFRANFEKSTEAYREVRGAYQQRFEQRKEASAKLQTALISNDLTVLDSAFTQATKAGCDPQLLYQAKQTIYKLQLSKSNQRLKKAFSDNNIQEIVKSMEMIREFDIEHEIDFRLVNKANILSERASYLQSIVSQELKISWEEMQAFEEQASSIALETLIKQASSKTHQRISNQLSELISAAVQNSDKTSIPELLEKVKNFTVASDLLDKANAILQAESDQIRGK